jgi:hypothetical protein
MPSEQPSNKTRRRTPQKPATVRRIDEEIDLLIGKNEPESEAERTERAEDEPPR